MGQVSKLNFVDAKLGASTVGQQTTRIVYDSEAIDPAASYVEFFKTFQNKTLGQTNLTTNKLDASESMVIKTISFYAWNTGGLPWYAIDNSLFKSPAALVTVTVGNQEVIKRLPLQYNVSGQAFDRLHADAGLQLAIRPVAPENPRQYQTPNEIRLLTDIVIPPQVSFNVKVELSRGNQNSFAVTCALAGYGKIFSAGSSF